MSSTGCWRAAVCRPRRATRGCAWGGAAARASRTSGADPCGGSRATVGVRLDHQHHRGEVRRWGRVGARSGARPRAASRGRARTAAGCSCRTRGGVCHAGGGKHPRQCGPSRRPSTYVSPRPITRHSAIPRRFSAARACRARRPQTRRRNRPDPPIRSLDDRTWRRFRSEADGASPSRRHQAARVAWGGEAARASRTSGADPYGGSRRRSWARLPARCSARRPAGRHFVRSPRTGEAVGSSRRPVWRPARAGSRGRTRTAAGCFVSNAGGVCHAGGGKHPRQCGPSRRPSS